MTLRVPLAGLMAALLAWPLAAQTTVEDNENPSFGGQVRNSPVPSRKTPPPRGGAVEEGADIPINADRDTAAAGSTTRINRRRGNGASTAPTAVVDDTARVTSPDGATIETRALPVLRRSAERPPDEDDAGGRIKPVPDPDADPEDRDDARFVRAPEGKTYDLEEPLGAPLPTPATELQRGATLRQLDKMTGQIVTFDIAVGQSLSVARLTVTLDACRSPDDNDTHGTMAHLKIWDSKLADADAIFAGWMFAESPALSALDHPRYDLWVINCTTVSAEASAGNE